MSTFHNKPNVFVSHVQLKVEDLDRSLAFYQDLFGFRVMEQAAGKAVLTADGQTPLLTIEQPEDIIPKQKRTTGLYHYALLLPTREDLGKLIARLLEVKYPLQGASDHGTHEALYLQDPDDNGIEIAADTDPSTWRNAAGQFDFSNNGPMDVESVIASANGERWDGMPEETLIGHLHLHVTDLEKTKEFYRDGLGLDVTVDFPQGVFFSSGGYHHHIGTNIWNGPNASKPAANSVGMRVYTLVLPDGAARDAVVNRLKGLGYPVKEEDEAFFTEDPAGNRMKLIY